MKLTFLGGAETVTGSRFLIDTDGTRVLVDCGLFQGLKRLREHNWEPFVVPASSIDTVVLTHAHLDHTGYLPRLAREGFDGRVWCTRATAALTSILLRDAARIQEEDARVANKRGSSKHHPALPLFTADDAERALELLRPVPFESDIEISPTVTASFHRAGHILGAASVRLATSRRSILFSGDLGRSDDPVMRPPAAPATADHIVVESTYGNRLHSKEDAAEMLATAIGSTARRDGIILIPAFAVGRAQTILHLLARLRAAGRIPQLPTYLNSPMAVDATELFLRSPDEHRLDAAEVAAMSAGVEFVRTVDESKRLTARRGPMIVLSASGMLSGGRVLHHLFQVAPNHRNTIILVGFQAAGTRGESLLNGASSLRVFGQDVPVRARVLHLDSLSAHADADGLVEWLRAAPAPPTRVSVVHGEPAAAEALRRRIHLELGWDCHVPALMSSVNLASSPLSGAGLARPCSPGGLR